jgi:membrane protease YdiL (CAAX protease family)
VSGWPKSALYTAVGLVGLGFIIIFLAWNGAAGKDYVQGQLPYLISGGVGGLALVISGLTVAIVQSVRREAAEVTRRLDQLLEVVQEPEEEAAPATPRRRRAS